MDIPAETDWREKYERQRAWEQHERQFARQVLDNVKALKKDRGMTTADLAEKLVEAGWPTTVNSLNGMLARKGRATITVTEVIAFAEALGVPPLDVIFGRSGETERVIASFNLDRSPQEALERFTGGSPDPRIEDALRLQDEALLRLTATQQSLVQALRLTNAEAANADGEHPEAS